MEPRSQSPRRRQNLQLVFCLWWQRLGQDASAASRRSFHHQQSKGGARRLPFSEQFTNEFIDAIQHGTLVKFRKKCVRGHFDD